MSNAHRIAFRNLESDADYAVMRDIVIESTAADGQPDTPSVQAVRRWCSPTDRFDPHTDIALALFGDREIGFTRASWYTGKDGIRLYVVICYLIPSYRIWGALPLMIRATEERLREVAIGHPTGPNRAFQAWAQPHQTAWIDALEGEGYRIVRTFHNMLRPLAEVPPVPPMPEGLEVRPVEDTHYRAIFEAQREVQLELFEINTEHWADSHYEDWRSDASHTPQLWQVAWDGDQVAGMVLPRIGGDEGQGPKRGYTEHVFVRKPWRRRGLASALVTRCLKALKDHGCDETELGVDAENESGAHAFYRDLGFETFSRDLWLRKPFALRG